MKQSFVYILLVRKRIAYVGKAVDPADRWRHHSYRCRYGNKRGRLEPLYSFLRRKGLRHASLVVVSSHRSEMEALKAEAALISRLASAGVKLLNLYDNPLGSGRTPSEATRRKLRAARRRRPPASAETRKRMSDTRRGRKLSAEALEKWRRSRQGYTHSKATRAKISQSMKRRFA